MKHFLYFRTFFLQFLIAFTGYAMEVDPFQGCDSNNLNKRELFSLVHEGKIAALKDAIGKNVISRIRDERGNTLLHAAVLRGDVQIVKYLSSCEPELAHIQNKTEITPLIFAKFIYNMSDENHKPLYRDIISHIEYARPTSHILLCLNTPVPALPQLIVDDNKLHISDDDSDWWVSSIDEIDTESRSEEDSFGDEPKRKCFGDKHEPKRECHCVIS